MTSAPACPCEALIFVLCLCVGVGWRKFVEMICPTGEAKYFCKGDWTASIRLILFDKLARARTGFEDAATAPTSEASKAAVIFGQMMPNCPSREFLEFEPTKRVAVSAMSSNMRLRS